MVRQTTPFPSTRWFTARVATPAATLLLLPRYVDDRIVDRCLDHALAHRLATVAALARLLEHTPTRAVCNRKLLVALLADRSHGMGHRSRQEQRVGRWLNRGGLFGWICNFSVRVAPRTDIEVDFAWPDTRLALEVSPFFTHGSREKQERDAHRRRVLVANNWRVVEATDPDVENEVCFAPTLATLRTLGAS